MDSGANKNAPAGDGQGDNIVNEQPIEISSDSSNGSKEEDEDEDVESGSEPDLDSDSDISIINSVSDSSDSHNDERLEDEFQTILAMPYKEHKLFMQLCHTAFKLNVFEKIDVAISEFERYGTIPPHIWLRYLKTLKVVTQTPLEQQKFQSKCRLALSSYYDEQLAEFILKNYLEEQPLVEHAETWAKLLADYGLERVDFVAKSRAKLSEEEDGDKAKQVEQMLSKQCVTWQCNEDEEQMQEIQQLMDEFKQKLRNSTENTSYLQEMFLLRIDTLTTLDRNIKMTMAKIIYERCLAKYSSDSGLWLDYLAFMQRRTSQQQPGGESVQNYTLLGEGCLNCTPLEIIRRGLLAKLNVQLNHKYLQLMELHQFSVQQIDEELSRLYDRIERYMDMTVELQLDYLAYRVRNTNVEDEQQVIGLRAAFRQAWDRLSEQYGEMADTGYEVLQLWALVEYAQLKSPSNGAAIWSEILSYPGSSDRSHLWLAYAQMEGEYNAGRKMRTVLQQALSALSATAQNVEAITDLYRRYERCFGTSDTIADCQTYCEQIQSQIQRSSFVPAAGRYQRPTTYAQGRRGQQQQQSQDKSNRKQHLTKKPMPSIKRELEPKPKKMMTTQNQKQKEKEKPKQTQTQKPTADNDEPKEPNFKYSPHLEANKIFIKNLYAQCTKKDLTEIFQAFGTIKDVRLVYRHNKIFKGIAYIEYEQPEQARKAVIGGDGLDIGGQNIVVAISNPPPKGAPTAAGAGAGAGVGTSTGLLGRKQAEKRRMPTTLIPTKLVMLEAKRRKKLELDEDMATPTPTDANGSKCRDLANGGLKALTDDGVDDHESGNTESASESASAPKSNDDFRKLFNI
ncbi:hypothetical protein ACLKA6_016833 [Drosophila palustris]